VALGKNAAPPHGCATPGCGGLVERGQGNYCPTCRAPRQAAGRRRRDIRRGSASSRGYGVHHRRWRRLVLARDPLCVDPYRVHGARPVPATVADHVVPLQDGGGWALENGQGLCDECHERKTAEDLRRRRRVKAEALRRHRRLEDLRCRARARPPRRRGGGS
jgi:5-methylcytosine-specific restriction protein A